MMITTICRKRWDLDRIGDGRARIAKLWSKGVRGTPRGPGKKRI
jgi:hypothetical protein